MPNPKVIESNNRICKLEKFLLYPEIYRTKAPEPNPAINTINNKNSRQKLTIIKTTKKSYHNAHAQ